LRAHTRVCDPKEAAAHLWRRRNSAQQPLQLPRLPRQDVVPQVTAVNTNVNSPQAAQARQLLQEGQALVAGLDVQLLQLLEALQGWQDAGLFPHDLHAPHKTLCVTH
jgi:hypothetical protein